MTRIGACMPLKKGGFQNLVRFAPTCYHGDRESSTVGQGGAPLPCFIFFACGD